MNLSDILAPITKKTPAKLKDRGIAAMVQGGYGLWNPNAGRVMRLPLGQILDSKLETSILTSVSRWTPQMVSCPVPEGAMAIAVRQIKRSSQLPVLFVQRVDDYLEFQGYDLDKEDGVGQAMSILRSVGIALSEKGLSLRRLDETVREGIRCRLVYAGEKGDLGSLDGLRCDCGWIGGPSSSMAFGGSPSVEEDELQKVHTPGVGTIEELCGFLSVTADRTVKTMCFADEDGALVAALVRGDRKISLDKLSFTVGKDLHPASDEELKAVLGDLAGFLGPIGLPGKVSLWADSSVDGISWAVVGANEKDYHITGARWERDFSCPVADLAMMEPGDLCPLCGKPLTSGTAVSLATLELWNTWADREPSLIYVDQANRKQKPFSWLLRLDMVALEGALFRGGRLPLSLAPFPVMISPDSRDDLSSSSSLAMALERKGILSLLDDRGIEVDRSRSDSLSLKVPIFCVLRGDSLEINRADEDSYAVPLEEGVDSILSCLNL
nr:YbaK/EbsC family protein [uncultured Dethiosulfovibrio sp.]